MKNKFLLLCSIFTIQLTNASYKSYPADYRPSLSYPGPMMGGPMFPMFNNENHIISEALKTLQTEYYLSPHEMAQFRYKIKQRLQPGTYQEANLNKIIDQEFLNHWPTIEQQRQQAPTTSQPAPIMNSKFEEQMNARMTAIEGQLSQIIQDLHFILSRLPSAQ